MNHSVKMLKRQLVIAICMVMVAAIALGSSTYAWYVTNRTVTAVSSSVAAQTNGFILQIVGGTVVDHSNGGASISVSQEGHEIAPSSTDDMKNWYVLNSINSDMKANGYTIPSKLDLSTGKYEIGTDTYNYAYVVSTYTLYTVSETGYCDVYLDGSDSSSPAISVTVDGSTESDKIVDSLRVGLTFDYGDGNGEQLSLVYAPTNEDGKMEVGNDADAQTGWRTVANATSTKAVTYPYIYEKTYTDKDGNNYGVTKSNDNYVKPATKAKPVATDIDYDGVVMRVYIWMEGTDSDCVNSAESITDATYNVSVRLAGISQ